MRAQRHRAQVAWVSEVGARRRNEDAIAFAEGRAGLMCVLADGAGGHRDGALAARSVVSSLTQSLLTWSSAPSDAGTAHPWPMLQQALEQAHACLGELSMNTVPDALDAVCASPAGEAQAAPALVTAPEADVSDRMYSTAVVLWLDASHGAAVWGNVGDSRLYRLAGGTVRLLSEDDSLVHHLVLAGVVAPERAHQHPSRNQLVAALGMREPVHPHGGDAVIEAGVAYLMCSDGWWEHLDEAALSSSLHASSSPKAWLDNMARHIAQQAGPRQDNFSAVALWLGDLPHVPLLEAQHPSEPAAGFADTLPGGV